MPADGPDDQPPGRPPPPSLWRVLGVAVLVVAFLVAVPALYTAGRDLSGSRLVGVLVLVPPAAGLGLVYRGLFR
jgi:hypothetical protein